MSDPRATVTLIPIFEDTHPLRTLTITDNDKTVAIGRASKRETRKRSPAPENAWFESRVMSRDHAFLNIPTDHKTVFITDCGSTHGTYLNDIKLVTDADTPLSNGDIIRFGVDVDRGQEVFEAIEVRFKVQWLKPQHVAIPDDDIAIKLDPSPSTNSFSVPEDDSDIEAADILSDNTSKESAARPCETTVLQPADTSPVSPVPSVQGDEHAKDEPELHWGGSSSTEESITKAVPGPTPLVPDLPSLLSDTKPPSDDKPSTAERASTEPPSAQPTDEADIFPATCYQKVPEDQYSDWTIMRPMFMRLADMAWGESNMIPDVDHERRIIHAARRCSLSKDSYWLGDDITFKPCIGTEVYWEHDSEESDTSFHRMPGSLLRYWSVDKRRYWIICDDDDGEDMNNWWWIVEKPEELLSEEVKQALVHEDDDYNHKCWIIRNWEPQMVGDQWCEAMPYWDPTFNNRHMLTDDESLDSDEEAQRSDGYVSELDGLSDSMSEDYGVYPYETYDNESIHGADYGADYEVSVQDFDEDDGEEGDAEDLEEDNEASDESENDSDRSSGDADHTDAVEVSKHLPEETDTRSLYQEALGGQSVNPARIESNPLMTQTALGMTNPGARFPTYAVSGELPRSCENKYPPMQRKIESTVGVPSLSHEFENRYHDGPFSTSASVEDASVPHLATSRTSNLKRTATEMQSSPPEPSLSQDAQRLPVEPASQPDLNPDTIPSEAKDAITSALAENVSAFAENGNAENERPAKRVKSNHPASKSLASHATTAVVSALLGGLGTIAMLAALPNEYFQ
ncbi:hypothetical protein ACN38_g8074 [Penicillium nordicum]|uniref:FHA domain-containing protein n=1 Tax=Penicillium nordicum TaxID=229535 RepID=A0A0M8P5W3_9EURO|nr:hypothetical protein ACN38_g8074 [Penicillium nordicum]